MSVINKQPFIKKILEETSDADLALPTTNGTYTLKLTVLDDVNTFSWILDS